MHAALDGISQSNDRDSSVIVADSERLSCRFVAALSVSLFVFASPNYAQAMMTSDTDAAVVAAAPGTRQAAEDRSIRPFTVHVPEAALNDLRRRIAATRWPDRETVTDHLAWVF
jgi:hypothetical protein